MVLRLYMNGTYNLPRYFLLMRWMDHCAFFRGFAEHFLHYLVAIDCLVSAHRLVVPKEIQPSTWFFPWYFSRRVFA
jgi:hypothetical protein